MREVVCGVVTLWVSSGALIHGYTHTPVMYCAAGDRRNTTAAATSSTVPSRLAGMEDAEDVKKVGSA